MEVDRRFQQQGLEGLVVVWGPSEQVATQVEKASELLVDELRLVDHGTIRSESLDPASLGLTPAPLSALAGGDLQTNARCLEAVLRGEGPEPHTEVVALNTALVLWAARSCDDLADGLSAARRVLAEGEPWRRLQALAAALPQPAAGG